MPRSSKAPPLPPEPDYNELIQNDVARIKRLLGLDVNRLAIGSDIEGIVTDGPFGSRDYTITGVNTIEFVNVSSSIGPAQGSTGPPNQVTGLTVTPQGGSNTQLNLAWTAVGGTDFNYYNVYRATTSGFIVGPSYKIAQPVTNSYNNTGLSPGTTYYYRVSTTNDAELEGAASSQVSGTTTAPPAPTPNLWLQLNNTYTDSSGNGSTATPINSPTFGTPGQFGSHYLLTDANVINVNAEHIRITSNTNITLDMTTGFSLSFWLYPTIFSGGGLYDGVIYHKCDIASPITGITVEITGSGKILFVVTKAGTTFKFEVTGMVLNEWQHIACTFNPTTNTGIVYRNGSPGTASSNSSRSPDGTSTSLYIGKHPNDSISGIAPYLGRIDEIQYFKGAILTPAQVTNLMNTNST